MSLIIFVSSGMYSALRGIGNNVFVVVLRTPSALVSIYFMREFQDVFFPFLQRVLAFVSVSKSISYWMSVSSTRLVNVMSLCLTYNSYSSNACLSSIFSISAFIVFANETIWFLYKIED